MNLCGVARALVDMAFDAVEAVAYAVFDFDDAADELWYRDDLVAKETEEEVADPEDEEPQQCDSVLSAGFMGDQRCSKPYGHGVHSSSSGCAWIHAHEHESSSPPLVSAGGGEPAASAHSPSASQAAGNQLDEIDLRDLGEAARYRASQEHGEYRAYWYDLAEKAFRIAAAM